MVKRRDTSLCLFSLLFPPRRPPRWFGGGQRRERQVPRASLDQNPTHRAPETPWLVPPPAPLPPPPPTDETETLIDPLSSDDGDKGPHALVFSPTPSIRCWAARSFFSPAVLTTDRRSVKEIRILHEFWGRERRRSTTTTTTGQNDAHLSFGWWFFCVRTLFLLEELRRGRFWGTYSFRRGGARGSSKNDERERAPAVGGRRAPSLLFLPASVAARGSQRQFWGGGGLACALGKGGKAARARAVKRALSLSLITSSWVSAHLVAAQRCGNGGA
jgi:hypothetical protein